MIKLWKSLIARLFPKLFPKTYELIPQDRIDHLDLNYWGRQEIKSDEPYEYAEPFEFVPLKTSVFKSVAEILEESRKEATLRREAHYAMIDTVETMIHDIEWYGFWNGPTLNA